MVRPRASLHLVLLLIGGIVALGAALCIGEVPVRVADLIGILRGHHDSLSGTVVLQLRLPRALAAFACGGLLAMAGALMQMLLRNPLADPYVLGVSGGAALGALTAMLLGAVSVAVEASAFGGALIVMLLVFGLAHGDGSWTRTRLLLVGVVIASGCMAGISLLLTLAPEQQLPGMLFWLMGDISNAQHPGTALTVLLLAVIVTQVLARDFNLLARGEALAQSLGVATKSLRVIVFLLSSLLTAVAVSLVGSVGFIGLLVPHLVRMWLGNDHRVLLPAVALAGGVLLLAADTAARSVLAPTQLPVGILTALIGVPVFLFLLGRHSRGEGA
ncbi:MAG TPA: iron ABC transporter permease [Rhodocyclaceae bacterium]|nr:iron ABC transporter permease [Rhodocyclaceae bacterium]